MDTLHFVIKKMQNCSYSFHLIALGDAAAAVTCQYILRYVTYLEQILPQKCDLKLILKTEVINKSDWGMALLVLVGYS